MRKKEVTIKGLLPMFTEVGKLEKRRVTLFFTAIISVIMYLVIITGIFYSQESLVVRELAFSSLVFVFISQVYGSLNSWLLIPIGIFFSIVGYFLVSTLLWLVLAVLCALFITLHKKEYHNGRT